MLSLLARLRAIPSRVVAAVTVAVAILTGVVVAVVASVDRLISLVGLALYISAVLGLSAAVTYAVIKISPAKSKSKSAETG